jgi:molybdopterin molybdotransferase
VVLRTGRVEPLAVSGASILSSTTRADGFVLVPADLEGYPESAVVDVFLYDVSRNNDREASTGETGPIP